MTKLPAMLWYTGDWLKDPAVSVCSPATRGVWTDLLCAMHEADRSGLLRGTDDQLARLARCSTVELVQARTDLQATGAADVTERNGQVTIINRRMHREWLDRKANRDRQMRSRSKRGGGGDGEDVTEASRECHTPSSSSSSLSKETPLHPPATEAAPPQEVAPSRAARAPRRSTQSEIALNRENWKWEGITQADADRWKEAYPAVDVIGELRRAIEWCKTNPAKGQKQNYARFIVNWLARAQERGGSSPSGGRFKENGANGTGGRPPLGPRTPAPPPEPEGREPEPEEEMPIEDRIRTDNPPFGGERYGEYERRIGDLVRKATKGQQVRV
jgi:hypothetical protein